MDFIFGALLILSAQICTTFAETPCVCERNYSPVCGSDGITYGNPCLLECEVKTARKQIVQARSGSCEETVTIGCLCTADYTPVCGSDGRTYGNKCTLGCTQSNGNPSLVVEYEGACKTPSESRQVDDFDEVY